MNIETIKTQLRSLRLSAAARELEQVLLQHKKAVNLDWLSDLLERELDARRSNALRLRFKQAGFPEQTSLETFDFRFNAQIDEAKIRELATLQFLDDNGIALFLGPCGVGKSHIALALGVAAAQRGHRVYWATHKKLITHISLAKAEGTLDELFKRVLSCKLWVIDDWAAVSMNREIAEEVFDLIDRRKYSAALIVTSNRDPSEWGEVFPSSVLANATIDRIFEQAHTVVFRGKSYRLKGRITTREVDSALHNQ
jgi:DNA replication protein DnaC